MNQYNEDDKNILEDWKKAFQNNEKAIKKDEEKSSKIKKKPIIFIVMGAVFLVIAIFAILLLTDKIGNGEESSQNSDNRPQVSRPATESITSPQGIVRSNEDYIYHLGVKVSKDVEEIPYFNYYSFYDRYKGFLNEMKNIKTLDFNDFACADYIDARAGLDSVEEIYYTSSDYKTFDVRKFGEYKNLKHLDLSFNNVNQYEFDYLKKELANCDIIYNYKNIELIEYYSDDVTSVIYGSKSVNGYSLDKNAEFLPIYNYMVNTNTRRLKIGVDDNIPFEYLHQDDTPFIENITKLGKLEELSIGLGEVVTQFLEHKNLNNLKNLKFLSLYNIDGSCDLKKLNVFENLEELEITFLQGTMDLSGINLPNLKKLKISISQYYPNINGLFENSLNLQNFSSIEILELNCIDIKSFEFLAPLKNLKKLILDTFTLNNQIEAFYSDTLEELYISNYTMTDDLSLKPFSQLKNLKVLSVTACTVTDYELLYYLTNLEILDITVSGGKTLLNFVSRMQNLKYLRICGGNISDLSQLEYLYQLETLILDSCDLTDISTLPALPFLEKIGFMQNPITNIEPLSKLKELKELNLSLTNVADLSPISALDKLRYLDFSNNEVNDLDPLESLVDLEFLDLRNIRIGSSSVVKGKNVDFNSISVLPKLEEMNFSMDISQIKYNNTNFNEFKGNFPALKNLSIDEVKNYDLKAISKIKTLESLSFRSCRFISDTSPIAELVNLRTLAFEDCDIDDVLALNSLENLVDFRINDNKSLSLKGVEGMKNLVFLDLYGNKMSDITELIRLKNSKLKIIKLSYNGFKSVDALAEIETLNEVEIYNNQLSKEYIISINNGKFNFDLYCDNVNW